MTAPTKLFLDIFGTEKIWKILDENRNIIGEADEFGDAITHARETSDADITTLSGAIITQNMPEDLISEHDIIDVLAELAGVKLQKYIPDDLKSCGYTIEFIR